MKRDYTLHFRKKIKYNGKTIPKKNDWDEYGYVLGQLTKEEKDQGYMVGSNGGYTITVLKKGEDLHWGVAKCNMMDAYGKKIGRLISTGRAEKSTSFITPNILFSKVRELALKIVEFGDTFGLTETIERIQNGVFSTYISQMELETEEQLLVEN